MFAKKWKITELFGYFVRSCSKMFAYVRYMFGLFWIFELWPIIEKRLLEKLLNPQIKRAQFSIWTFNEFR